MKLLGLSAFCHDSAAALVVDGEIVAAAQEERFTRRKHDPAYPAHSIAYCCAKAGIGLDQLDAVVFYDKRQKALVLERLQESRPDFDWRNKLLFSERHVSHAASAFYPSPFDEALVLTMDGAREGITTSVAIGRGKTLEIVKEFRAPHSLGLLYSAFTFYTGFKVNSGEYKVMGLAPYGVAKYKDLIISEMMDLKADGSFRLDMTYFDAGTDGFEALFGQPARRPETEFLTQFHMDVAASIQAVLEEIILRLTRSLAREYGIANLCLAGGVALNCVANGKVLRDGAFKELWIQPAAGDAGAALGAALAARHIVFGAERNVAAGRDSMQGSFLGPDFEQHDIERRLHDAGAVFEVFDDDSVIEQAAQALADGRAIGWMQGRMEFGPRALGGRSILGDPRSPTMQKTLNLKIKYRESFRPFAPSILHEDVAEWFELDRDSPYMLLVADVRQHRRRPIGPGDQALFGIDKLNVPKSDIPAVTHVDYSARVQTVHPDTNPRYHALISRFKEKTGCPIVVNTSFNVRGEPIVCTPEDAFFCFMGTEIDVLVVGNCVLVKDRQNPSLARTYETKFEPD